MEHFEEVFINNGHILSESKIDNSNIDLNDYCHEATKIEMIIKVSVHSDKLFNSIKGLKIHISKLHYDVHKKQITDKYVLADSNNKDNSIKENSQQSQQTSTATEIGNKMKNQVDKWVETFPNEMNNIEFSFEVELEEEVGPTIRKSFRNFRKEQNLNKSF